MALPAAFRLVVYDHTFPNKITSNTTPACLYIPGRTPDMATIRNLRLVRHTIKGEVDHHHAVVVRQYYVALARSQGLNMSYLSVPVFFTNAYTTHLKIWLAGLE